LGPRFNKSDQVIRKSHREQIGYIVDEPRLLAGEYWYQVQFGGGIAKKVQESDLELYEGAQDIWSLLKRRVPARFLRIGSRRFVPQSDEERGGAYRG